MICPKCARWIPEGSVYCMFCGAEALKAETPQQEQEPAAQDRTIPDVAPGWAERFAAEFPRHRWMILQLASHGWTEQMLRNWLKSLESSAFPEEPEEMP